MIEAQSYFEVVDVDYWPQRESSELVLTKIQTPQNNFRSRQSEVYMHGGYPRAAVRPVEGYT